jgi:hypothetical protein
MMGASVTDIWELKHRENVLLGQQREGVSEQQAVSSRGVGAARVQAHFVEHDQEPA